MGRTRLANTFYRSLRAASVASMVALMAFGCSSDDGNGGDDDGAGNRSGSGSGGSGASTSTGGTGAGTGGSGTGTGGSGTGSGGGSSGGSGGSGGTVAACPGLPLQSSGSSGAAGSGEACAGVSYEAERVDVDMYIMMDRSVSMAETVPGTDRIRWEFVREAVERFVSHPDAADVRMGIQFFNQSGEKNDEIDCDVSRYATPAVAIGPASEVGDDIVAAIADTRPGGFTPTLPALQGAVQHAKEWAEENVGRATVVVLVTDGLPTQCQNPVSVSEVAAVAKEAAEGEPRVRTYAMGIAAGFNLDTIARSGGTKKAFIVDEASIADSFVTNLLNIAENELACEYEIPEPSDGSMQVDVDKVQVVYSPANGDPEEIPKAGSLADCGKSSVGGWYYDNPANPTKIMVCPCTCERFAAGRVDVRLGCEPRPIPIE